MAAPKLMSDIMDLCELSPAYVRAIAPYQPGKPITEVARELGLDERAIVKLRRKRLKRSRRRCRTSAAIQTVSS